MAVSSYDFSRTRRSSSPYAMQSSSMFGFGNPMGQSYNSGRGYWSPERMEERFKRAELKIMEGKAGGYGGYGGGGGSRGGGGGGGPAPMLPPMGPTQPPVQMMGGRVIPQGEDPRLAMARANNFGNSNDLADLQAINFGNNPGYGQDYAAALARMQSGVFNERDLGLLQQRANPTGTSRYNSAIARQQFKRYSLMNQGGLMGAAQQALFT